MVHYSAKITYAPKTQSERGDCSALTASLNKSGGVPRPQPGQYARGPTVATRTIARWDIINAVPGGVIEFRIM